MGKVQIIRDIISNISELFDLSFRLGDSFNQDSTNLINYLGLDVQNKIIGLIINIVFIVILYKLTDKLLKGVLLNTTRIILILTFIMMSCGMIVNV